MHILTDSEKDSKSQMLFILSSDEKNNVALMDKILKTKCSNLERLLALTLLLSNNHMPKYKSQPTGIKQHEIQH